MADEPQNTEPEQENPATAYQPTETVVTVYDQDGREHFAASTSKFVVDGLADGTLTTEPPAKPDEAQADGSEQITEEVPGGTDAGSAGDDQESGNADGDAGSGDGAAEGGASGRRRRTGTA